jgi:hypothetical protein
MFPYKSVRNTTSQVLTACWCRFKPSGRLHSSRTALSCRRIRYVFRNVGSYQQTWRNIPEYLNRYHLHCYTWVNNVTGGDHEKKKTIDFHHQCGQTYSGTSQAPNSTGARTEHKRSMKLRMLLSVPCNFACLWCLVWIAAEVSASLSYNLITTGNSRARKEMFIIINTYIIIIIIISSSAAQCGLWLLRITRFLDHTQRCATAGRTPLDKWSARRRDLYLTTRNTHNKHPCSQSQ